MPMESAMPPAKPAILQGTSDFIVLPTFDVIRGLRNRSSESSRSAIFNLQLTGGLGLAGVIIQTAINQMGRLGLAPLLFVIVWSQVAVRAQASGPASDGQTWVADLRHLGEKRYNEAGPLLRDAVDIYRHHFPAGHPALRNLLRNYAYVLDKLNRKEEASLARAESPSNSGIPAKTPVRCLFRIQIIIHHLQRSGPRPFRPFASY
jgi:hypothetical protein